MNLQPGHYVCVITRTYGKDNKEIRVIEKITREGIHSTRGEFFPIRDIVGWADGRPRNGLEMIAGTNYDVYEIHWD